MFKNAKKIGTWELSEPDRFVSFMQVNQHGKMGPEYVQ